MNISDVRIRVAQKEDSRLKAIASITIDNCFVVHDIKIIEGSDSLFIAMPSRKNNEGEYKDVAHPLNTETREELKTLILSAYQSEIAKA
jgi:stage V sporulation protein G